jgi:hypothetical protein
MARRHHLKNLFPICIVQSNGKAILGLVEGSAGSLIAEAFSIAVELQMPSACARITAVHAGMRADLDVTPCPNSKFDAGTIAGQWL